MNKPVFLSGVLPLYNPLEWSTEDHITIPKDEPYKVIRKTGNINRIAGIASIMIGDTDGVMFYNGSTSLGMAYLKARFFEKKPASGALLIGILNPTTKTVMTVQMVTPKEHVEEFKKVLDVIGQNALAMIPEQFIQEFIETEMDVSARTLTDDRRLLEATAGRFEREVQVLHQEQSEMKAPNKELSKALTAAMKKRYAK